MSKDISIRAKLIIGVCLAIASLVIICAVGVNNSRKVKADWDKFGDEVVKKHQFITDIRKNMGYGGAIHQFKNYVLRGAYKDKYFDGYNKKADEAITVIKRYRALPVVSAKEIKALDSLTEMVESYRDALVMVKKLIADGNSILEIDKAVKINDTPFLEAFGTLNQEIDAQEELYTTELNRLLRKTITTMLIITALVLIVGIPGAIIVLRSITTPLNRSVEVIEQLATGDLTVRLNFQKADEFGRMGRSFDKMVAKFQNTISDMTTSSEHLASASEELSITTTQLSSGMDEQAVRASHVATASQEMSATVTEVARNASDAARSVVEANDSAKKGSEVVTKTITSINGISETAMESRDVISSLGTRSNEIGEIARVIDEIADQTNLLALNAAIEAARAGEQGRGFAVVADEVRKLAERTSAATKQISGMINSIQTETKRAIVTMDKEVQVVEEGVGLAQTAGATLNEISEQVDVVSGIIGMIATASEEQSVTSDQISGDIDTVARITSESSQGIQQVAAASQELAALATQLQSLVSAFKVTGSTAGGNRPATAGKITKKVLPAILPE